MPKSLLTFPSTIILTTGVGWSLASPSMQNQRCERKVCPRNWLECCAEAVNFIECSSTYIICKWKIQPTVQLLHSLFCYQKSKLHWQNQQQVLLLSESGEDTRWHHHVLINHVILKEAWPWHHLRRHVLADEVAEVAACHHVTKLVFKHMKDLFKPSICAFRFKNLSPKVKAKSTDSLVLPLFLLTTATDLSLTSKYMRKERDSNTFISCMLVVLTVSSEHPNNPKGQVPWEICVPTRPVFYC